MVFEVPPVLFTQEYEGKDSPRSPYTGAECKRQAPFQGPTGGESGGDWEKDCRCPKRGQTLEEKDLV